MKKLLLTFVILAFGMQSYATHLMGGEITVLQLPDTIAGPNKYLVTLLAYRDTVGIPMAQTATFNIQNSAGTFNTSITTPYDSIISGNLLPLYPYGVEVYLFYDTLTITTPGHYYVSWTNCCRNGAIQNLANPLSNSMYLETEFEVFANQRNSTPIYLVPPAIFLQVNTPWQYNPLPFDFDGDSLYWSLDTPLTSPNVYCAGYTHPSSAANGAFTLDPVTGTVSWTANMVGNFVASIMVDEYRYDSTASQWAHIGKIRRDMQFIVVNASSSGHPRLANAASLPKNQLGTISFDVAENVPFSVQLLADHPDTTVSLDMGAYGEIFQRANPAYFTKSPTGINNQMVGDLSWTPNSGDLRTEPYRTVIRITDGYIAVDEVIFLQVTSSLGKVEQTQKSSIKVFPNPVVENVYLSVDAQKEANQTVEILNILGQRQVGPISMNVQPGTNNYMIPMGNLPKGIYIVAIKEGGKLIRSERIIKK